MPPRKPVRYKDAGVDIDEADRAVSRIKKLAQDTMTKGVLTGIGSFGAGFELSGYKKPVLGELRRWGRDQIEGGVYDRSP